MASTIKLQEECNKLKQELGKLETPTPIFRAKVKAFMRTVGSAFAANNELIARQNPKGDMLVSIRNENKCLTKMLTFCETILKQ